MGWFRIENWRESSTTLVQPLERKDVVDGFGLKMFVRHCEYRAMPDLKIGAQHGKILLEPWRFIGALAPAGSN